MYVYIIDKYLYCRYCVMWVFVLIFVVSLVRFVVFCVWNVISWFFVLVKL